MSGEIHGETFVAITSEWQSRGEGAAATVQFAREAVAAARSAATEIETIRARDDLEAPTKARLVAKVEAKARPMIEDALNRLKLASHETVAEARRTVIPSRNYSDSGAAARERELERLIVHAADPVHAYLQEVERAAREGNDANLALLNSRWGEGLLATVKADPGVVSSVREAAFLNAASILAKQPNLAPERMRAATVLMNTKGPRALDNVELVARVHSTAILDGAVRGWTL